MVRQLGRLFFAAALLLMVFGFHLTVNGSGESNTYSKVSGNSETCRTNNNLSKPGYKPVADTCSYIDNGEGLIDNVLYKEWCERTFDNGVYIYEAYKNIAFNIKYTPEPNKTDYWQTPLETSRLKKGDCEDAVFHFFSQLPPGYINAAIIWGWVIDNKDVIGRAHVWYQLIDKQGRSYVVEGFSKDWDGIIPMEIVNNTESRVPIFTISHSSVSRLANSPLGAGHEQIFQSLPQFADDWSALSFNQGPDYELIEFILYAQDNQRKHKARHNIFQNRGKEISNILKKLNDLFYRYERQRKDLGFRDSLMCRR